MRAFLFLCISIIFIVTPFQQGLYFDKDMYWVEISISCLFLLISLFLILKGKIELSWSVSLMVLLPIALALSLIKAETPLGGLQQFLRWSSYCCFFYLVHYLSFHDRYRKLLTYLITGSGFMISIFSMAAYTGLVTYQDSVVAQRLGGILQYPNSFAALLGSVLLFSFILLSGMDENKWRVLFWGLPVIPYLVAIGLTGSRGVIIILPFFWLIGLVMLSFRQQIYYFVYSLVSICLAGLILGFSSNKIQFAFTILLSLLFIGFVKLFPKIIKKQHQKFLDFEKLKYNRYLIPSINLVFFAIIFIVLINHGINADTFKERVIIAGDGLRASLHSILLGYGGDGWSVIFTKYQSLPYQTKNLHNGILEWLLSAGLLGFLCFITIFGCFFLTLLKEGKRVVEAQAVFVSILFVFVHSFIDFNFSYGTIWFFLLTLLAIGLPKTVATRAGTPIMYHYSRISSLILPVLAVVMLIFSYKLQVSDTLFAQLKSEKSAESKLLLLVKSTHYNPYDIDKWNTLGMLYAQYPNGGTKVKEVVQKLHDLEPNNSKVSIYSINLLEKAGLLKDAKIIAHDHIPKDLYNPVLRQESIHLNTSLALKALDKGEKEQSRSYAKSAQSEYKKFTDDVNRLKRKLPNESFNSRGFSISEQSQFYAALSAYINQDYKSALVLAEKTAKSKNDDLSMKSIALVNVSNQKLNQQPVKSMLYNRFNGKKEYQLYLEELKKI